MNLQQCYCSLLSHKLHIKVLWSVVGINVDTVTSRFQVSWSLCVCVGMEGKKWSESKSLFIIHYCFLVSQGESAKPLCSKDCAYTSLRDIQSNKEQCLPTCPRKQLHHVAFRKCDNSRQIDLQQCHRRSAPLRLLSKNRLCSNNGFGTWYASAKQAYESHNH